MIPACWLKKKGSRLSKPSAWGNSCASPDWSTRPTTGCGARATFFGAYRNLLLRLSKDRNLHSFACHMPWQFFQNCPSGHLGGWVMLQLAEEMLDVERQRVDIPTHARTAHNSLLQKRLKENICWIIQYVPLVTQSAKGLNWTDLNSSLIDNGPVSFF